MSDHEPATMEPDERDEFLDNGGTGVISFATPEEDAPHSIPVSYGYDAAETTFYFRLAVDPDSEKGNPADRAVTFVTYDRPDDTYRSVIARGRLVETAEESIATQTLEGFERVQIPLVDIFGRPPRDVPFQFYQLAPEEITSRKESSTPL